MTDVPVTDAATTEAGGADGDGARVRTLGKTQRQHRIAGCSPTTP